MPLSDGVRLGPYEILGPLRAGGMGEVYRAKDSRLGRDVALKLLPDRVRGDRASAERFLTEARAASALNHPHICTVYDVGEQDGRSYLVMELLEGKPLDTRLAEGAVTTDQILDWGSQIAEALEAAHARGILHRDIKPGNLFVTARGQIKVLDFGLAKLTNAEAETIGPNALTLPGTTLGTAGYMSPEQTLGREVDARSDVFSLGAVLYQMATGRQPFTGPTPAAIYDAILHQAPRPPLEWSPDLPPDLNALILQALAKDPAARPAGMRELAAGLKRVSPAPASDSPSIAVLPFANMSVDPENEYFSDGMAEEIINALCKIEALRVASRTSSFAFKGKNEDIRGIGRTLGVTTVLEGSVRKAGQRLRVTAQLIKVDDGYHLWSERFDRQLEDVFAVQDEISEKIVDALRVHLSPREKQKAKRKIPTQNMEAYECYLRGRGFLNSIGDRDLDYSRRMFERAVELDPGFVLGWVGIVEACLWVQTWFAPNDTNRELAERASQRALALDPDLAEAHVARGHAAFLRGDEALAEREYLEAIRLDPRLWTGYYFCARIYLPQGRLAEAAEMFQKAFDVRPDDYDAPSLLCTCLEGLGKAEERAALGRQVLGIIDKQLQLHPDDVRAVYFAAGHWAALGEKDKALAESYRALQMAPQDSAVRYNVACTLIRVGQVEEALDLVEQNVKLGWGNAEWLAHDPDMDPVRSHPRFIALLETMPKRRTPGA